MKVEDIDGFGTFNDVGDRIRSSEVSTCLRPYLQMIYRRGRYQEPEKGRRAASRTPSLLGSFLGLEIGATQALNSGSQRSSLFPWDNAAGSSSTNGAVGHPGSVGDRMSLDNADVRVRGPRDSQNGSGAGSPLPHSRAGSLTGINVGISSGRFSARNSVLGGEDFQFEGMA